MKETKSSVVVFLPYSLCHVPKWIQRHPSVLLVSIEKSLQQISCILAVMYVYTLLSCSTSMSGIGRELFGVSFLFQSNTRVCTKKYVELK